jgi:putative transposase
MTYGCVKTCASEFPVARVCAVLNVSESGYYAWLKRTPSQREQANQTLKARIVGIWEQFKQCYGVPRIHAELQAQGMRVGKVKIVLPV